PEEIGVRDRHAVVQGRRAAQDRLEPVDERTVPVCLRGVDDRAGVVSRVVVDDDGPNAERVGHSGEAEALKQPAQQRCPVEGWNDDVDGEHVERQSNSRASLWFPVVSGLKADTPRRRLHQSFTRKTSWRLFSSPVSSPSDFSQLDVKIAHCPFGEMFGRGVYQNALVSPAPLWL